MAHHSFRLRTAYPDRSMALSTKGPFNRATHNPGICRTCPCSEFLAVEASKNTSYTGYEKCLACRHRASQHVWDPINPQVVRCEQTLRFCLLDTNPP